LDGIWPGRSYNKFIDKYFVFEVKFIFDVKVYVELFFFFLYNLISESFDGIPKYFVEFSFGKRLLWMIIFSIKGKAYLMKKNI